jgi:acyl-CoA reductase-like NAD-dependent aldehyde dehydrogenase
MAASHLKDTDLLVDRCFVGGQWIGVPSAEVPNPATKEVIARVPCLSREQAIEQAARAVHRWLESEAEAIEFAKAMPFGLASYLDARRRGNCAPCCKCA